ncbi:GNAT family N-acetyltransferase [Aerococcus kribbianus]|uniref:GNAT family N-acetyltransferase n=1 Tax=Aerococcus kribbianus TaxID=2999064 RepID=A0A9X3FM70_9LACT|nr:MULTISPECIES: GNAT family N-acetyltransferase [unclassified Aerococcus]MCZ0717060.1 GNAT family N-acetyltransferase [Aerococcus sp. YH-aer221]MCZ0725348.1 GNAT family N-acetyltransferase [Aerococcus sp. YH-aer222]
MTTIIRPYKDSDFDALHLMTRQTWYAEPYQKSPKMTDVFVSLDSNLRLYQSSFGLTAEKDGEVLGIFLGNILSHAKALRLFMRETFNDAKELGLSTDPVKDELLKQLDEENEINVELDKNHQEVNQAVVELFILSPSARGKGIGGELWKQGLAEFKDHGVSHYTLHTDSACDYGFYDYKGLKADPAIPSSNDPDYKFFLYAGNIETDEKA